MTAANSSPTAPAASHRAQRSMWTWASGFAAALLTSAIGFLVTPLLLRWLGTTAFGAWAVIGEWLGYLALGQQALGPGAVTVLLLQARHQGDQDHFAAVARRGWNLYLWAAAWGLLPAAALAWWGARALHAGDLPLAVMRWSIGLACACALLLAPAQLFRSVLETVQRGYRVRAALLAQALVIFGLQLAFSWRLRHGPWGLAGMAAADFAGMSLGAGLWWWWARVWLPRWRRVRAAAISARQVWRINQPLMLAHLGNQLNQLTDATVISLRLGSAAVTPFAITQTLVLAAGGRMSEIGASSWAALGEMRARSDPRFGPRVVELAGTVLGVSVVFVSIAAAFTHALVNLWVGAARYGGARLTEATAGSAITFSFVCFFSWLVDTQGDTRYRLVASSVGSAINLALSLLWLRSFGLAGVAFATWVAYLATDAWFLPRLAVRRYGVSASNLAWRIVHSLACSLPWAIALGWLMHRIPPPATWPEFAAGLLVAVGAGAAYCWVAVLGVSERDAWRGRLRALAAR